MINFDAVDFSERRPEEVISFFWRSVYIHVGHVWRWLYRDFEGVATFADLLSYTHASCSFVQLNEAITIVSGSHCAPAFPYDLQVKRYSELKIVLPKWRPNSSVPPNNVAHGGFVRGKQRVNNVSTLKNLSCMALH